MKKTDKFEKIFESIKLDFEFCLMGHDKTKLLYEEFLSIGKKGNTAEIGVFMGFSSKVLALINGNNTHICYDTFEGIAHANPNEDIHKNGEFACSLEKVQKSINLPNVIYKKGTFPETFEEENMDFVFVHSDTDTYHGTKTTFDKFAKLLCIGGKFVCDDYKWKHCPGVEKAVKEFYSSNRKSFNLVENGNQCILTKKATCVNL